MMLPLYQGVMTVGAPVIEILLSCRAGRGKEDLARMRERRGMTIIPRPAGELVWLHASSVGESMASLVLVERLLHEGVRRTVLLTTGTVSSARLMAERLPERALHQYVPVDRPAWVRSFLDHWRPDLALVMESEFWPFQLTETRSRGIPIVLVNGRMSERSYSRWRLAGPFARPLFSTFELVMATNSDQAGRFLALGARRVLATGNLKCAAPALNTDPCAAEAVRRQIGGRPVWLAASTHAGEDEIVLETHSRLVRDRPDLLTIIAPRHPDRGEAIAKMAFGRGFRVSRRGAGEEPGLKTDVYVADTLGEMGLLFDVAEIVFVAGSLVPVGGHNPVEPAHFGCAILFGPLMSKNAEIASEMVRRDAAVQISGPDHMAEVVSNLFTNSARRRALCWRARCYVDEAESVLDSIVSEIAPYLEVASAGSEG
ncbi:MAG: 3-deoxy-D-manno-octulosonic acid transferase [Rhodospirillaceae bacterium]|nr:3-deoxy-D-manno-octulosonic acid transferase [Rhodospirillaceae bacterium]